MSEEYAERLRKKIYPKDFGAGGRTREELSNLTLERPLQEEFRKCLETSVLGASPVFISKSGVTGCPTSDSAEMTEIFWELRAQTCLPTAYQLLHHLTSEPCFQFQFVFAVRV